MAVTAGKYLRVALVLVDLIFIFGIYTLTVVWPSGWSWHTGHSDYLQMILGVYATLGVFLLIASRNPLAHLSLIWFTVWSSVVHAVIMGVQSFANPQNMGPPLRRRAGAADCCRFAWVSTPRGVAVRAPSDQSMGRSAVR